jgi:hypothetical protein
MKKIIGFCICTLLIALVIPTSVADVESITTSEGDVELNISAGWRGKDIGIGFAVYLLNHKIENVTVSFSVMFDYLIWNNRDFSDEWTDTLQPELPYTAHISCALCIPDGMKFVTITVEVEDIIVTRNGFAIDHLLILF